MTGPLLSNRDALAEALRKRASWWPTPLGREEVRDLADALLSSGAVIDAATLADDVALNLRLWDVLDEHGHNGLDCRPEKPMDYTVTAILHALAAALSERAR